MGTEIKRKKTDLASNPNYCFLPSQQPLPLCAQQQILAIVFLFSLVTFPLPRPRLPARCMKPTPPHRRYLSTPYQRPSAAIAAPATAVVEPAVDPASLGWRHIFSGMASCRPLPGIPEAFLVLRTCPAASCALPLLLLRAIFEASFSWTGVVFLSALIGPVGVEAWRLRVLWKQVRHFLDWEQGNGGGGERLHWP